MRTPYLVKKNISLFEVTFTDRGSCIMHGSGSGGCRIRAGYLFTAPRACSLSF